MGGGPRPRAVTLPAPLGRRAARLTSVRALKSVKGRRESGRFSFEGATLLDEAVRAGVAIEALYVTADAYSATPLARELDQRGTPTFTLDRDAAASLSDVEAPSGILAVAPMSFAMLTGLLARGPMLLVLGDLNDPGNAGTLVRSAEAFGAGGVVFGRAAVDPYHPKVVRAAMGSLFRVGIAVAEPEELHEAATAAGTEIVGLAPGGEPLRGARWPARCALVVGHERRGLGPWAAVCARRLAIPMATPVESLNAAVAGSIALFEAACARLEEPPAEACQESI